MKKRNNINSFKCGKESITPVVATILLIVVAVITVVGLLVMIPQMPKLINVLHRGSLKLAERGYQFYECSNLLNFSANDTPDLSDVSDLSMMFFCSKIQ